MYSEMSQKLKRKFALIDAVMERGQILFKFSDGENLWKCLNFLTIDLKRMIDGGREVEIKDTYFYNIIVLVDFDCIKKISELFDKISVTIKINDHISNNINDDEIEILLKKLDFTGESISNFANQYDLLEAKNRSNILDLLRNLLDLYLELHDSVLLVSAALR